MKVGNKEKCCEKDCKTPQEYMDNHFVLHIVKDKNDEKEENK